MRTTPLESVIISPQQQKLAMMLSPAPAAIAGDLLAALKMAAASLEGVCHLPKPTIANQQMAIIRAAIQKAEEALSPHGASPTEGELHQRLPPASIQLEQDRSATTGWRVVDPLAATATSTLYVRDDVVWRAIHTSYDETADPSILALYKQLASRRAPSPADHQE